MSGWLVTDLISPNMIRSQQDALGGRHQISINNTAVIQRLRSTYYWAAPEAYLGNKVCVWWLGGEQCPTRNLREHQELKAHFLATSLLVFAAIVHTTPSTEH